jgi:two-component system, NtrC family, nitrogen regulation sensor histidine kinase NtrY
MSLKTKLWIWAVSVYLVTGFVAWQLLTINKWYFVAAEAAILISFGVFLWIRQSLFRPVTAISEGIKMLEEQDFNTRLAPTGQKETDQLINVYNKMLDALRHERIQQEETHYFLRKLIDASPQGIIILDFDENIKDVNPAAASILGLSKEKSFGGCRLHRCPVSGENACDWRYQTRTNIKYGRWQKSQYPITHH